MKARTTTPSRAFDKGLRELRVKDVNAARAEIMAALGVNTAQSLRNYARGLKKSLDVEKAANIAAIFARYGVADPWGA